MQQKHKFVFEYMGGTVTAYKTQAEIAVMLKYPDLKLISVNFISTFMTALITIFRRKKTLG